MNGVGVFFIVLLIAAVVVSVVVRWIKIVPQAECWITELFGKYHASWKPGLHIKIPFCERIVSRVSLKEQTLDFPPQGVITKDNVMMMIDSVVFLQVFDSKLYTYGATNPIVGIENLTSTNLRNLVGNFDFDALLSSRDEINTKMTQALDEATDPWGIKIKRVEIKGIIPPADIQEAMTKQMKAERERRQTELEAEAHKKAVITRAEGDKRAKILEAEAEREARVAKAKGEAESIRLIYEAEAAGLAKLSQVETTNAVLQLKGLEALKTVADGNATKIFMPSDMTKLVTLNGIVSESMGIGSALGVDTKQSAQWTHDDSCCNDSGKSDVTKEIVQNQSK